MLIGAIDPAPKGAAPPRITGTEANNFLLQERFGAIRGKNLASFEESASFKGQSLAGITFRSAAPERFTGGKENNFLIQEIFSAVKNQNLASFENSSGGFKDVFSSSLVNILA